MLTQIRTQRQQLKILPQQIQLLNIFHMTDMQLSQLINDEINDNPLLEQTVADSDNAADKNAKDDVQDYMGLDEYANDDIPDYKTEYQNYLPAESFTGEACGEKPDFREDLKKQFRQQSNNEEEINVATYLIDSLNDNGMLEQDLVSVCEYLSFSVKIWKDEKDVEQILEKVQKLEPAGVGARNLRECFLLKLRRGNIKRPDVKKAIELVEFHFDELQHGNLDKIRRALELDDEELKIVLKLLASLKTASLADNNTSAASSSYISPDFVIADVEGELKISLARQWSNDLYINKSWIENVEEASADAKTGKSAKQYINSKLQSARWFINAIKEREINMLKIMRNIVKFQKEYFLEGDIMLLKPMILKDIATVSNLDISTVSRITSNKYAETPFGVISLKNLFSEGLPDKEGTSVSNKVLRKIIEDMIVVEDKKNPYTDQQIAGLLTTKGYRVARRTVAKYREQLHIPAAQQRGVRAEMV